MAGMWGKEANWINDSQPSVHEGHYLTLDSSKARVTLGWQQRLTIETALEYTVRWYRSRLEGADMARETQAQIASFEQLVR
jgi:CDP-glucose 4,6-dehydratase